MRKIFKFMAFKFLENALNLDIFTHAPTYSKLATKFLPSHPRQKEITHSPRHSKILFSQQQKGVEKILNCFIKTQSENMNMTWKIRLFIFSLISDFFKCDGFPVLKIIFIISHGITLLPLGGFS